MNITVTLSFEDLMELPGEAVIRLLEACGPSAELLQAARAHETRPLHGKGRWVVLNFLTTTTLSTQTKNA